MIGNVLGTIWHVGGMFALPFLMAFLAALFLEVSEVAETLPVLVALAVVANHKTMTVAVSLDETLNFFQQGAGLLNIFDILPFFPEMPRWRNW